MITGELIKKKQCSEASLKLSQNIKFPGFDINKLKFILNDLYRMGL